MWVFKGGSFTGTISVFTYTLNSFYRLTMWEILKKIKVQIIPFFFSVDLLWIVNFRGDESVDFWHSPRRCWHVAVIVYPSEYGDHYIVRPSVASPERKRNWFTLECHSNVQSYLQIWFTTAPLPYRLSSVRLHPLALGRSFIIPTKLGGLRYMESFWHLSLRMCEPASRLLSRPAAHSSILVFMCPLGWCTHAFPLSGSVADTQFPMLSRI